MEIGQHSVDSLEMDAGVEEEVRLSCVSELVERLDGADRGGADSDDALGSIELTARLGINLEALCVEFILFDRLRMQRLKSAEADVEGDFGANGAGGLALLDDLGREMKSRRRRGHAAAFAGKDGLVTLTVDGFIGPADVWRERNVPVSLNRAP